MSIEIAEYLAACGESEMADAVENMHNRLEAFADGLDRDCIEAAGRAVEDLTRQRDVLLSAIKSLNYSASNNCHNAKVVRAAIARVGGA